MVILPTVHCGIALYKCYSFTVGLLRRRGEKKHGKRGGVFVCSGRGLHSCSPLAATPGTDLCSNNVHVMDLLFGIPPFSVVRGIVLKICLWLNETQKYLLRYSCPFLLLSRFCRSLSEDSCLCFWLFSTLLRPENILTHWVQSSIVYSGVFVIGICKKKKKRKLNPSVTLCFVLFFF